MKEYPRDTVNKTELTKACIAEFLGTAIFIYIGTGSVVASGQFLTEDGQSSNVTRIMPISMAFGMGLMVVKYTFGGLSGGQLNPAVTLTFLFIRIMSPLRAFLYIMAQMTGAILGSCFVWASCTELKNNPDAGNPPFALGATILNPILSDGNGFFLEFFGTFIVLLTVIGTVVTREGPSYGQPNLAPLVIGFVVLVLHIVLVPFTGCGLNPARTFGPAIVNSCAGDNEVWASREDNGWIFYIAPCLAAVFAALLYETLWNPKFEFTGDTHRRERDAAAEMKKMTISELRALRHRGDLVTGIHSTALVESGKELNSSFSEKEPEKEACEDHEASWRHRGSPRPCEGTGEGAGVGVGAGDACGEGKDSDVEMVTAEAAQ